MLRSEACFRGRKQECTVGMREVGEGFRSEWPGSRPHQNLEFVLDRYCATAPLGGTAERCERRRLGNHPIGIPISVLALHPLHSLEKDGTKQGTEKKLQLKNCSAAREVAASAVSSRTEELKARRGVAAVS